MSGDYSRQRFDPSKNYSGVLMQQGRVQLDAEWNEMMEIIERRIRAGTFDTFGSIGRCVVPSTTPDGFKIDIDKDNGKLTIGVGRIYVDGLLVENRGTGQDTFDAKLAEGRRTNSTPYDDQPHPVRPYPAPASPARPYLPRPNPPERLASAAPLLLGAPSQFSQLAARHLVYVDVWQREVTHLEDPHLTEPAVGVDTTNRIETVWQVKMLPVGADAECDSTLPEWEALVAPSAGRLSTSASSEPTSTDPCLVPPTGKYKGLDNRLYRLEIHKGGRASEATFKWSRDNASLATSVTAIGPGKNTLTVAWVMRDPRLRFKKGDWIEITDDRFELSGQPGEMCRIETVDDGSKMITLNSPLQTPFDSAKVKDLHTRIRRWDQSGTVKKADGTPLIDLDATRKGVIPVPPRGTSVILEDGVRVTFDTEAQGEYRVGDYWTFAARTVGADVDQLDKAPPRGIHHHYGPLAIVERSGASFSPKDDCRVVWPPAVGQATRAEGASCCKVMVPGGDIQKTIDELPPQGGCICLTAGNYEIKMPIEISGRINVTIHGVSPGAVVVRRKGTDSPVTLVVSKSKRIELENIRFEVEFEPSHEFGAAAVILSQSRDVSIRTCEIGLTTEARDRFIPIGAYCDQMTRLLVERTSIANCTNGILVFSTDAGLQRTDALSHRELQLTLLENEVIGPVSGPQKYPVGSTGIWIGPDFHGHCKVIGNQVANFNTGISIGNGAAGALISRNHVFALAFGPEKPCAIDTAAIGSVVTENDIGLSHEGQVGIRVTAPDTRVDKNDIHSTAANGSFATGIWLLPLDGEVDPPDRGVVEGNVLGGRMDGIVIGSAELRALRVTGVRVSSNRIASGDGDANSNPRFAISVMHGRQAEIFNNHVVGASILGIALWQGIGNRVKGNNVRDGECGIATYDEGDLTVADNVVENMQQFGIGSAMIDNASLSRNRIAWCAQHGSVKVGLGILLCSGRLLIESCEVVGTGAPAGAKSAVLNGAAGIWAWLVHDCRIIGCQVIGPGLAADQDVCALSVRADTGSCAEILDNVFSGHGAPYLVQIGDAAAVSLKRSDTENLANVIFSNNRCQHVEASAMNDGGSVYLNSLRASVLGNQVSTDQTASKVPVNSFIFPGGKVSALGNVTTGDWHIGPRSVLAPAEYRQFNHIQAAAS